MIISPFAQSRWQQSSKLEQPAICSGPALLAHRLGPVPTFWLKSIGFGTLVRDVRSNNEKSSRRGVWIFFERCYSPCNATVRGQRSSVQNGHIIKFSWSQFFQKSLSSQPLLLIFPTKLWTRIKKEKLTNFSIQHPQKFLIFLHLCGVSIFHSQISI